MAWDMKWFNDEHTIILFTINKGSTWEDFHLAMNNYSLELDATDKRIHAIIYDDYGLPPGNPMPHFRATMPKVQQHRNAGAIVTVSPNKSTGFLQSVIELTGRFLHLNLQKGIFVKTIDDAVKRIQLEEQRAGAVS